MIPTMLSLIFLPKEKIGRWIEEKYRAEQEYALQIYNLSFVSNIS